jgi:hypothetical protein
MGWTWGRSIQGESLRSDVTGKASTLDGGTTAINIEQHSWNMKDVTVADGREDEEGGRRGLPILGIRLRGF